MRLAIVSVVPRRKAVWGSKLLALALIASTVFTSSCGDTVQQGTGNSFLILNGLEAASGAEPTDLSGFLLSDVVTVVDDVPTIFNDVGRGAVHPGPEGSRNDHGAERAVAVRLHHHQPVSRALHPYRRP